MLVKFLIEGGFKKLWTQPVEIKKFQASPAAADVQYLREGHVIVWNLGDFECTRTHQKEQLTEVATKNYTWIKKELYTKTVHV